MPVRGSVSGVLPLASVWHWDIWVHLGQQYWLTFGSGVVLGRFVQSLWLSGLLFGGLLEAVSSRQVSGKMEF